jgi:undecaprenyl-diphosphatase
MSEFLYAADCRIFYFINQTLSNGFFDLIMPFLTDLNRMLAGKILFVAAGIAMLIWGGRTGRIVVVVLILAVALSDQFSSFVIKPLVDRLRPCRVLEGVRLLVDCGSGRSFPSSHAVNMFAAAAVLAFGYPRLRWAFYSFAAVIAFSRVYVGVHYPSDIAGGACIGLLIGLLMSEAAKRIQRAIEARGTAGGRHTT